MPSELRCPQCSSENVIFSKKRGAYVCEDCGHVLPEKPVSPMRIFLSYERSETGQAETIVIKRR
jgi:transcription initiation factor TFIIIB Brf1 subunit/transcription initiation factor TFIIB